MNQADLDSMIATQLAAPIFAAMLNAFMAGGDEGLAFPSLDWVESSQQLALEYAKRLMAEGKRP